MMNRHAWKSSHLCRTAVLITVVFALGGAKAADVRKLWQGFVNEPSPDGWEALVTAADGKSGAELDLLVYHVNRYCKLALRRDLPNSKARTEPLDEALKREAAALNESLEFLVRHNGQELLKTLRTLLRQRFDEDLFRYGLELAYTTSNAASLSDEINENGLPAGWSDIRDAARNRREHAVSKAESRTSRPIDVRAQMLAASREQDALTRTTTAGHVR